MRQGRRSVVSSPQVLSKPQTYGNTWSHLSIQVRAQLDSPLQRWYNLACNHGIIRMEEVSSGNKGVRCEAVLPSRRLRPLKVIPRGSQAMVEKRIGLSRRASTLLSAELLRGCTRSDLSPGDLPPPWQAARHSFVFSGSSAEYVMQVLRALVSITRGEVYRNNATITSLSRDRHIYTQ